MSRLRNLLTEATILAKDMDAELNHRMILAEKTGWYEDYDEFKADAYEDAVDRLDIILEAFAKDDLENVTTY